MLERTGRLCGLRGAPPVTVVSEPPRSPRSRPSRCWLGLAALFILVVPGRADAACPPFDFRNYFPWLAATPMGDAARLFNPPGKEDSSAAYMLNFLWGDGAARRITAVILPVQGPVPLEVAAMCLPCAEDRLVVAAFDPGDGTPEMSAESPEGTAHTYRTPGKFRATVRLRDRQGQTRTHSASVTAMTAGGFEAELRGRWLAMKAALLRGKMSEALECVHSESRPDRRQELANLTRAGRQRIEQMFVDLEFEARQQGKDLAFEARERGSVRFLRPMPGTRGTLIEVEFEPDYDGLWRMSRF